MLVAACGEENPSATSSDDTHSMAQPTVVDADMVSSTTLSTRTTSTLVAGLTPDTSTVTSTTSPQRKSGQVTTTSVVKIQPSTTVQAAGEVIGTTPVVSSAPSKTRPTPTIAPECDVMPLADCRNVDLRGLDLYYANFQGANLAGANMSGMDLTGADFSDANLMGANLIGATLDYSFFFNTNLTDAKLTRVSMDGIVWDETTIWPVGFVPPDY